MFGLHEVLEIISMNSSRLGRLESEEAKSGWGLGERVQSRRVRGDGGGGGGCCLHGFARVHGVGLPVHRPASSSRAFSSHMALPPFLTLRRRN